MQCALTPWYYGGDLPITASIFVSKYNKCRGAVPARIAQCLERSLENSRLWVRFPGWTANIY